MCEGKVINTYSKTFYQNSCTKLKHTNYANNYNYFLITMKRTKNLKFNVIPVSNPKED